MESYKCLNPRLACELALFPPEDFALVLPCVNKYRAISGVVGSSSTMLQDITFQVASHTLRDFVRDTDQSTLKS